MAVHNKALRNSINNAAHRSMCNPYSILSVSISAIATGVAIWGVLTKTKDPLYATLTITVLNSVLKFARLLSLQKDNARLRHFFFSAPGWAGNTRFNSQIEKAATWTAPCVGVVFSILGLGLLSLENEKIGEIFSLSAPFALEVLSAISESILDTANSKLRNLYEMRENINLEEDEELINRGKDLDPDCFLDACCAPCC